ncbi:putative nuclease HARBI1 [Folsomia candida]|uniref:Putative nuclease HARBI1 n=1 Tax=Folsomia candida TaxID=158441 RepID=A0A226F591_FOLCA|nr:putative nuclease HARBI1 [Folsomia candida]
MESDIEDDILILSAASLLLRRQTKKKKMKKRRFTVSPYLKLRNIKGRFVKDFEDLRQFPPAFKENFRMTPADFDNLLKLLEPQLSPKHHSRPDSFTSSEKLAMTLEYLASGSYQRHIASVYRASKQAIGKVIADVCDGLYQALKTEYLKKPTSSDWLEISNRFNAQWNMPNCLGAIDGKHVAITIPPNSGSAFYNYKGFFSIVLMAVGDADYRLSYIDVGSYGSEGDSTVFRNSAFGKAL